MKRSNRKLLGGRRTRVSLFIGLLAFSLAGCGVEHPPSISEKVLESSQEKVFLKNKFDKQLMNLSSRIIYSETDIGSLVLELKEVRQGYLYKVNRAKIEQTTKTKVSPKRTQAAWILNILFYGLALPSCVSNEECRRDLFGGSTYAVKLLEREDIIEKTDDYVSKTFPVENSRVDILFGGKHLGSQLVEKNSVTFDLISLLSKLKSIPAEDFILTVEIHSEYPNSNKKLFVKEILVRASDIKRPRLAVIEREKQRAAAEEAERLAAIKRKEAERLASIEREKQRAAAQEAERLAAIKRKVAEIEEKKKRVAAEKAAEIQAEKDRIAAEKAKMQALMVPLIRSCSTLGFKDGSKEMSKCVLELYKFDQKVRGERSREEAEQARARKERANQVHRQNTEMESQREQLRQLQMIREQTYQACVRRECAFWLKSCFNSRKLCVR